jgi:hypothetical protein
MRPGTCPPALAGLFCEACQHPNGLTNERVRVPEADQEYVYLVALDVA